MRDEEACEDDESVMRGARERNSYDIASASFVTVLYRSA